MFLGAESHNVKQVGIHATYCWQLAPTHSFSLTKPCHRKLSLCPENIQVTCSCNGCAFSFLGNIYCRLSHSPHNFSIIQTLHLTSNWRRKICLLHLQIHTDLHVVDVQKITRWTTITKAMQSMHSANHPFIPQSVRCFLKTHWRILLTKIALL